MGRLKRVILIMLAFISGTGESRAQTVNEPIPGGIYYLVRHAEKDTGKNPVLTVAGYARAGDLYRVLKNDRIGQIYVSQYQRSQLTADSLRIYLGTDTIHYLADTSGNDLLKKIISQKKNHRNVLIIGHSNTIPVIIKKFGITGFVPNELPDHEYDNLYVITKKRNKISLKKLKYGKASVAKGLPDAMKPLQ